MSNGVHYFRCPHCGASNASLEFIPSGMNKLKVVELKEIYRSDFVAFVCGYCDKLLQIVRNGGRIR